MLFIQPVRFLDYLLAPAMKGRTLYLQIINKQCVNLQINEKKTYRKIQ